MNAREPPSTYLNKLRTYLDPSASKSAKKRKNLGGDGNSTQVLSLIIRINLIFRINLILFCE